jgi:hypothetical protein
VNVAARIGFVSLVVISVVGFLALVAWVLPSVPNRLSPSPSETIITFRSYAERDAWVLFAAGTLEPRNRSKSADALLLEYRKRVGMSDATPDPGQ